MEVVVTTEAVKTCKAPVKSSPTNQHPVTYRPDDAIPVAQPTVSKHWRDNNTVEYNCILCINVSEPVCVYCRAASSQRGDGQRVFIVDMCPDRSSWFLFMSKVTMLKFTRTVFCGVEFPEISHSTLFCSVFDTLLLEIVHDSLWTLICLSTESLEIPSITVFTERCYPVTGSASRFRGQNAVEFGFPKVFPAWPFALSPTDWSCCWSPYLLVWCCDTEPQRAMSWQSHWNAVCSW